MDNNEIRVLIAKPGLDGHDRGAKVITRYLSEQNIKTKFSGIRKTPEQITELAAQMDANIIGISILSGAHLELVAELFDCLYKKEMDHVKILVGGIIPESDKEALSSLGVKGVFGPGTSLEEIETSIRNTYNE
ncbi:MAG: cobalamin B12-binding domain-containing protein [SAR202 cluster bacterium]|nr:cobalamin B12-binding domain-containing protein [SAR202 cluster bacterium]